MNFGVNLVHTNFSELQSAKKAAQITLLRPFREDVLLTVGGDYSVTLESLFSPQLFLIFLTKHFWQEVLPNIQPDIPTSN